MPVRRAIYRVSALLEMIDLEFERVLAEREHYSATISATSAVDTLDVDSLAHVLAATWPEQNKLRIDDYNDLLQDLLRFGVRSPEQLREIIERHRDAVLEMDRSAAEDPSRDFASAPEDEQRHRHGVFYTWVGLTRNAMELQFGNKWRHYMYGTALPIADLGLPSHLRKALLAANIERVVDLAATTEQRLMQLGSIDEADLKQIKDALANVRLEFGMTPHDAAVVLGGLPNIEELWDKPLPRDGAQPGIGETAL